MKYRRMGRYGLRLSEISLGGWLTYGGSVENDESRRCVEYALDQGVNFIDVADVYSGGKSEEVVGEILAGETHARKDLVVSSKVFWPISDNPNDVGLSRKHIFDSVLGSLSRLQLDYLDIYFCHRYDHLTPLEETISAMADLIKAGEVRYWGTSCWSAKQLERAAGICREMGAPLPAVEQPRYNMLDRHIELEIMESCSYHGLGIVPWSPLGGGLLTGKYNDGIPEDSRAARSAWLDSFMTEENLTVVKRIGKIAKDNEMTTAQLALAWILRRPEISSAIIGATKVAQLEENLAALEFELDGDTLAHLDLMLEAPKFHPVYQPEKMDRP